MDDPPGARTVGSKQVFKIDISGATDVTSDVLPGNALPDGIVPVTKSAAVMDLCANSQLPKGKQPEKWEGLAIGPPLWNGRRLILTGNDNDYSVTQTGEGEQFDVYVDFAGNFARCVLDDPTRCEINPAASDLVIDAPVALPDGFVLLPGVLHAYRASKQDLVGYEQPGSKKPGRHVHHDRD